MAQVHEPEVGAQPTPSPFQTFDVRPQLLEYGKVVTSAAKTDLISCSVQVIAHGGETNLHAHNGSDAIWLVLDGKAKFYTTDNEVVGIIEKNQGLVIPRGTPYWFESEGDDNLVILRFGATAQNEPDTRTNYTHRNFSVDGQQSAERPTKILEGVFFGDK
jgi:mannose-6-phosphate isomerase-like protein (cupin superfamily)